MSIFEELESNVRSYCRSFPDVFDRAKGALVYGEAGKRYIDFFSGAGALNYGHNNDYIKKSVLDYLQSDKILHALDMSTAAKREFMTVFRDTILMPRKLPYKMQFCGSTGTNAVEAALKLARKVKNRPGIFAFSGGFHGMSLGALAVSSNRASRAGAGIPLSGSTFLPFPDNSSAGRESIDYIERMLQDGHSGVERPAAIILETVQAEGGINVAPDDWMRRLREVCDRHDVLLICDDIQVGCFRTGPFFSFERAGIVPDMVVLSKSISGLGFPMSLLLMKPALDVWEPGEHTGTFRGNQIAFVAAKAALEHARHVKLDDQVRAKERFIREFLKCRIECISTDIHVRGMGMIWGIDLSRAGGAEAAKHVAKRCFDRGMIIERAGRDDTVVKLLPPLIIENDLLEQGCDMLRQAVEDVIAGDAKIRKAS